MFLGLILGSKTRHAEKQKSRLGWLPAILGSSTMSVGADEWLE